MLTREIGLEDMELSDMLKQEGMDLPNMVEDWKKKGMEHISEEEVNTINNLFIARQQVVFTEKDLGNSKRARGKNAGTASNLHQLKAPEKRGRRTTNEVL